MEVTGLDTGGSRSLCGCPRAVRPTPRGHSAVAAWSSAGGAASRLCVPGCRRAPHLRGPPECAGDIAPWSRLSRVDRTATENVADSFVVGASAPKRHCALKAGALPGAS